MVPVAAHSRRKPEALSENDLRCRQRWPKTPEPLRSLCTRGTSATSPLMEENVNTRLSPPTVVPTRFNPSRSRVPVGSLSLSRQLPYHALTIVLPLPPRLDAAACANCCYTRWRSGSGAFLPSRCDGDLELGL